LLAEIDADPELKERMLPLASRNARQILNLTSNLLSAANIQSGHFVVHPRPVDLRPIIESAVDTVAEGARARSQEVAMHVSTDPCRVMADPDYMRLALVNLLNNASKYSPDGAKIEVCTDRVDGHVRIEGE